MSALVHRERTGCCRLGCCCCCLALLAALWLHGHLLGRFHVKRCGHVLVLELLVLVLKDLLRRQLFGKAGVRVG